MSAPQRKRPSDLVAGIAAAVAFLIFVLPLGFLPWLSALLAGGVYLGVKLLGTAAPAALPEPERPAPAAMLQEIAQLNRRIARPGVRAKIDSLCQQAGGIQAYFQANPEAAGVWRGFFSECLGSTLEVVRRYVELARRIGEPDTPALQEFEGVLDSLGTTFANLHQRLIEEDVASYTADVKAFRSTIQALNDVSVLRVGGEGPCKEE
jgi:hypothetical protein